jgi:anti-sigma factor RsiW
MRCHVEPIQWVLYLDGELTADEASHLEAHRRVCPACRRRLARLQQADQALRLETSRDLPAAALARCFPVRAVSPRPEIMDLPEVAQYLRLSLDDLDQVLDQVPTFEIAGQVRVRRAALNAWIEQRERAYAAQRLCEIVSRPASREAG